LRHFLINILNAINPLYHWKTEKQKDREMILEVAREIGDGLRQQALVSLETLRVMGKFLDSFQSNELPESRVVRSEDEIKDAMQRYGVTQEDIEENDFDPFSPTI
jgi:hypothetical protein